MTNTHSNFTGSIPEVYDAHLGPMLFEFSAKDLASRVKDKIYAKSKILEVACGTGISTHYLREALPQSTHITATDLNPAMLDFAKRKHANLSGVTFEIADALSLPFDDQVFDAVICQFGIMFFPDKSVGLSEMVRMLKLYGAPRSNYYNMVKCALLEKGLEFEEVLTPPSQEPDFIAKSPMGKIPCLETDSGCLSESIAILDYLEEAYPDNPLLPADPYLRAKVRELVVNLQLNVELVGRRGFGVLRNQDVPEAVRDSIKQDLPRGITALKATTKFSPWIAGSDFSYADLVGYFTFTYGSISAKANADIDLFGELPGSKEWFDKVAERASVKQAVADQG